MLGPFYVSSLPVRQGWLVSLIAFAAVALGCSPAEDVVEVKSEGQEVTAEVHGDGAQNTASPPEIEVVQVASTDDEDPEVVITQPQAGNQLVAIAFSRSGVSHEDHTISGNGWSKAVGHDAHLTDIHTRRSLSVWTRAAVGNDVTLVQLLGDTARLVLLELLVPPGVTLEVIGSADDSNGSTQSAGFLGTGRTEPVEQVAVLAGVGIRNGPDGDIDSTSWSHGLKSVAHYDGGGNGRTVGIGFLGYSRALASRSSNVSWIGQSDGATAFILALDASLSGTPSAVGGD